MSTLEQLQKRQSMDKERTETNPMQAALEAKVREQLKEKSEQLSSLKQETSDNIRSLEKEKRELEQRLRTIESEKKHLQESLEKKMNDFSEKEKKYIADIQNLKAEREKRLADAEKQGSKDKENFKNKIQILEEKNKELENKRHEQIFTIENERTKFNMERDMLQSQKSELMEKNEMLEKKKEQLLKEKTQLEQKLKQNGRGGNKEWGARPLGSGFADHLMKSYAQKENGTSQAFAPGFMSKFGAGTGNKDYSATSSDKKELPNLPMNARDVNKQAFPSTTTPNLGSPVPQRTNEAGDETNSNC